MTSVNGCAVVYLSWGVHPKAMEKANNFFNSYKANPAGYDHELIVIMKGWEAGSNLNSVLEAAGKFSARIIYLQENRGQDGLDLGAYFRVSEIIDNEWVCFLSTYSHILHDNWLKILMEAVIKPNIGAISCSGNWGTSKIHTPVPNPHIRTNAFILRRKLWLNFIMTQGFPVNKLDTYKLEHGRNGLSRFIEQQGLQIAVTGKDKILYYKDQFPDSKTFAHPGLSNLLVGDNMSDAYLNFSSAQKRAFELNAWYKSFTPVINDNYIFVKFIYRNIYKLYALYGRWRFRFRRLPAVAGRCGGWFRCARRAASLLFFSGYLGLRQAWRQKASEGESGLPADPPEA